MLRFITLKNENGSFTTNFTNDLAFPISLIEKNFEIALEDFFYKKSDKVHLGHLNLEYFNLKASIPISCDHGESFENIFNRINNDLNSVFIKLEYSRRFGIYVQNFLKNTSEISFYENNKILVLPKDNNLQDLTVLQDIIDSMEICRLDYDNVSNTLNQHLPKKLNLLFKGPILQYLDDTRLKRTHVHSLDVVHVLCDLIEHQNAQAHQILQTIKVDSDKDIKPQFKKVMNQGSEVESINIRLVENFNELDWNLYLGDVTIVLRLQEI